MTDTSSTSAELPSVSSSNTITIETSTTIVSGGTSITTNSPTAQQSPGSSSVIGTTDNPQTTPTQLPSQLTIITNNPQTPSSLSLSPASPSSSSSTVLGGNGTITPGDQGLGSGAVAGIAIGTFIAGVIVALLCACLFIMLRKKKNRSHDSTSRRRAYRDSGYSQDQGTPMKQMTSSVKPVGVGNGVTFDSVMLEPISSSEIKTDMLAINSQILQHVDNNYHLKPVDALPATFSEGLVQAGYSAFTGVSIEQLARLLVNPQTRRAAIRHLISYFIFSRVTPTSEIETSLLPHHIIAFLRQMPPPERTSGSREAYDMALTKWRLLSAYLLQTVRSNRNPLLPQDSDIQPAITRNITLLRQILAAFVVPGAEKRQSDNLHGLMSEGAGFGLILFQQPETWVIDWEEARTRNIDQNFKGRSPTGGFVAIVLFPGLIRTLDEDGKAYDKTRVVLTAEVLQP